MELREYQQVALKRMALSGRSVYGDDPGTGKTPTTLRWLEELGAQQTLIVAPLAVLRHWEREAARWTGIRTFLCSGTKVERQTARQRFDVQAGPKAIITNYETLRGDVAHWAGSRRWDAFVCDEAHRLKGRSTQTFKAAGLVARRSEYLALVTGTPVLNRADEIWSLLHLIDPKRYSSFWRWAGTHFEIETTYFHGRVSRPVRLVHGLLPGHEEIIRDELAERLTKRPIEELLPDMPDIVETTLEVDLKPFERRAYDSMAKRFWLEIDGRVILASNEISKITRLRQLASDIGNLDRFEHFDFVGAKVAATADLLADRGGQSIVLCSYKGTVYALIDLLAKRGLSAGAFTGDQSPVDRNETIVSFAEGALDVVVGTHGALGEGVDGLQVADHIVLLDRDWTPARNEQAIARIRRSGQVAEHVFVTNIVARDTIDQTVAAALDGKQAVIDTILGRSLEDVIHGRGVQQ